MKNVFIETEIKNMELFAEAFIQRCEAGAMKDDGRISPEEAKILKKLKTAVGKLLKELSRIK